VTIELIVVETLERKLADVPVPRVDVASVRRVGRGRRLARIGSSAAAALAALGAVTALVIGGSAEPDRAADPAALPTLDFTAGLRGFYDQQTELTHLGGQSFDLGAVRDPATGAATTPYGLVFFGSDQSVRLLPADGRVRTLASSPARAGDFTPTVQYDPGRGLSAWLTRSADRVTLSVYEFGEGPRLIGSYPVPCVGTACASLEVAGLDQGIVFVRGDDGTRLIDPAAGPDAGWTDVTDGQVADVRNRVVLAADTDTDTLPPVLADAGWRLVLGQGLDSQLTLDGAHELAGAATLASTSVGGAPLALALPPGEAPPVVTLDSDGSVLVAQSEAGAEVYYDCRLAGACVELARLPGEPVFLDAAR